ncbi:phospholipase D-like domain-containing protein [Mycoplasmopsis lipofaciens]|uniref:phospholipase D-like domain-containing protein n=1 Tax=Mycoplasmopsis lipofaciens TaxID=114884 RepID=UPI00068A6A10|nr:phospholipase D-like domain-containing protein [Mycoplasmopsis lipofaciens]
MKKYLNISIWIIEAIIVISLFALLIYYSYQFNPILFIFFVYLIYVLNTISVVIIFNQTRPENSKLSWLLVMIVLPLLGNILYFTFGSKYRSKREKNIEKTNKYVLNRYVPQNCIIQDDNLVNINKINNIHTLSGDYLFYDNAIKYYLNLFDSIKKASNNIMIISYILKPGEILDTLCSILIQKARNGVKIRWLIDDFGRGLVKPKYFNKLKKHKNIQIVFLSKVVYPFIHSENFYRNHQKFFVIDNKIVFSGGCNISDEYVSLSKKYGYWADLNYRLCGNSTNQYILLFLKYWDLWAKESLAVEKYLNFVDEKKKTNSCLIYDSPIYDISKLETNFLQLFSNAKKSIKIVTPYFSVTTSIMNLLSVLLQAGIDVEVYFSGLYDKKIIHEVSLNELRKLQKNGLKLYELKDTFLHTKCGIIDDTIAYIGTSNMDMRSMYAQYELMDIISGEGVKDIIKIVEQYKQYSVLNSKNMNLKSYSLLKKTMLEAIKPLA